MIRLNQQKSDTMKNKIYENVLMLSHCGTSGVMSWHSAVHHVRASSAFKGQSPDVLQGIYVGV